MPSKIKLTMLTIFATFLLFSIAFGETLSLRNIITIDGMDENPLLGYGIVVGLKGSGDGAKNSQTQEILSRIANNFGFFVDPDTIKAKNSAVVLVSATVPPYASVGSRIDVSVSSVYDAKSLKGGTLVITPLLGGNNEMYAIASGKIQDEEKPSGVNGRIPMAAIMQRAIRQTIFTNGELTIQINEKLGISAISSVKKSIAKKFPTAIQKIINNRITLKIPDGKNGYDFIFELYNISVTLEQEPSILIDSKSGIIVAGGGVVVTEAAISFNGTRLNIGTTSSAWGESSTTESKTMKLLPTTTTVSELVEALNQIGAKPKAIIKILTLLHKNGNLKAKLIVE